MFKIKVLNDFDYYKKGKDVGGPIFVELGEIVFPASEWFDLPMSVLEMWLYSIIDAYGAKNAEFELDFMDGPYYVDCVKTWHSVILRLTSERGMKEGEKKVIYEEVIEFEELVNEIIRATTEFLELIDARPTKKREPVRVKTLEKKLRELKKLAADAKK
ncbi:MAG: hypothetical protein LBQ91_03865 [Oscillospiraceae bacterium]|jgi:hypothetical protein|nr:hypothetical protein [Oscillospiraceae bacterium]